MLFLYPLKNAKDRHIGLVFYQLFDFTMAEF